MDLKHGYPFWLIKDGLPYHYPKLPGNKTCDVVIIGAGISGALAAYHLASKGLHCIVLDKRTVGLGSTCASTALVQYELDKPLHELSGLIGKKKAEHVYKSCSEALKNLSLLCRQLKHAEAESVPSLYYAASASHDKLIEREFKARDQIGLDVKLLDETDIHKRYGFKSGLAIESKRGLAINAYMLTHDLCRAAIKKGAEVYDRTEVTNMIYSKKSIGIHTKEKYRIRCRYIIHASGYEAGEFFGKKIVKLQSTYAVVSEQYDDPGNLWKNRAMLINTADPYLYMRLTADNRVMIGGRDEAVFRASLRDKLVKHKSHLLARDFQKLFPKLDLVPEFSWTGTFGVTKDSLPYIGVMTSKPNTYYALGYGGNGILFSYMAAQIIGDLMTGTPNAEAKLFSFDRV